MSVALWYKERLTGRSEIDSFVKAIDDDSWSKIQDAHLLGNEKNVDHSIHTGAGVPAPIKNLFAYANQIKSISRGLEPKGVSPKIVHDISSLKNEADPTHAIGNIVMSKPYHQQVNFGYNIPIYGWATMATKSLFDAAGIGDMAERVYASEHNGVPMTHHVFAPDSYKTVADLEDFKYQYKPDLHDIYRIAVMDYLTNNIDRHHDNLMVNTSGPKHSLLAIDHERNFQYKTPLARHRHKSDASFELPHDYISYSALGTARRYATKDMTPDQLKEHDNNLAAWWNMNKNHIRDRMTVQLQAIKDPKLRQHIQDNFTDRWNAVSDWADENQQFNYRHGSLFDPEFKRPVDIKSLSSKYANVSDILTQHQGKDPYEIMTVIARAIRDNDRLAPALSDTVRALSRNMSADQLADHFLNNYDNRGWDVAGDLIWHQPKDKRVSILRSIKSRLLKYPDAGKSQLPFLDLMIERADQGLDPFDMEKTKVME